MANTLGKYGLGYTSREANKDAWIKRGFLKTGRTYYLVILVCVDYTMVLSKDTSIVINYLSNIYVLKEGIMGPSDQYLGANSKNVQTSNGSVMWVTHSADYCKAAI